MKKTLLIISIIAGLSLSLKAQDNIKIGGGYFGQTGTYPGLVFEFEKEKMYSDKASVPLRIDIGFYYHKRHTTGVFAEVNYGFRRYFKSGLFIEESIGFGILQTMLSADAVYQVDDNGDITESNRFNKPDFMPSISFGLGYDLAKGSDGKTLIWFRPKLYWQYPERLSSVFTPSLQVGFTKTINARK